MPDPNMDTAYRWAKQLGVSPVWYRRERKNFTSANIAAMVNMFDRPLVQRNLLGSLSQKHARRRVFGIMNVFLRWWSGCLSMAKIIASETREGPNTPKYRNRAIKRVARRAKHDRIYADGVKAATEFKRLRHQYFLFDGIPSTVLERLVSPNDIIKPWTPKQLLRETAISKIGPIMKSMNEKKEIVKGPNSGKRPGEMLFAKSVSRKNNTSNTSKSRKKKNLRKKR